MLFLSEFTKRLLHPSEKKELLSLGYGITNIVDRPSVSAAELTVSEYIEGGKRLESKLVEFKPAWIAFVGVEAYRKAFSKPKAKIGKQEEMLSGVKVWVLPSPSGLNAHYSVENLCGLFKALRVQLLNYIP